MLVHLGEVVVAGNHDIGLSPEEAPLPVVDSCILEHDEYRFYCTHRPEDNDTENSLFIAYDERRVNISCELLNYRCVNLQSLTGLLDLCSPVSRVRGVDVAKEQFGNED